MLAQDGRSPISQIFLPANRRFQVVLFAFAIACCFSFTPDSASANSPQVMMLQGTILTPAGLPQESASVAFTVELRSPGAENCLLFSETHSLNMTNSGGAFSLPIGSGTRSGAGFEATSTLPQALDNGAANITGLTCGTGTNYDPTPLHSRKVQITFDDGSGPQTLTQTLSVQSVPYALFADSAKTLGPLGPSDFLQTSILTGLTQTNVDSVFASNSNVVELLALIAGTSSQYAKSSGPQTFSGAVSLTGAGTGLSVTNNATIGGVTTITNNTVSTNSTTGAVVVSGGLGVGGAVNAGTTVSAGTSMMTPIIYGSNAPSGSLTLQSTSSATKGNILINPDNGNVGIGTAAPSEKLEVNGAIRLGTTANTNAGSVRWDGSNFQGYTGSAWVNFVPDPPAGSSCDTTVHYSTAGTYAYTVPANFGTITIRVWGGGGGGGTQGSGGSGPGSAGGTSSINSLGLIATGGGGGSNEIAGTGAGGGAGTASGGSVNTNGAIGGDGTGGLSGAGGASPNGGAGGGSIPSGNGSDGQSPGGGGAGGASGSKAGGGGGGGYVEKTYSTATLPPSTHISDLVVGGGGVRGTGVNTVYWGGSGGIGRISITCATAGQTPANDRGILFWNSGTHDSSANFVYTSSGNVGIGTAAPGQALTVVGTIESTSGGVKFPDGTTQTTAAPQSIGFHASHSSQSVASATSTTIINGTQNWDRGGDNYDPATGIFTAPAAGVYSCNCQVNFETISSGRIAVGFNGTGITGATNLANRNLCTSPPCSFSSSQHIQANAIGSTIRCVAYQESGSSSPLNGDSRNYFSCHYLGP